MPKAQVANIVLNLLILHQTLVFVQSWLRTYHFVIQKKIMYNYKSQHDCNERITDLLSENEVFAHLQSKLILYFGTADQHQAVMYGNNLDG